MTYKLGEIIDTEHEELIIEFYKRMQDHYTKKFGNKTIVLMEIGSFFEYYGIDAKELKSKGKGLDMKDTDKWGPIWNVAKVLDAAMKQKGQSYNPWMAGFPNYALAPQLDKLIKASYTVITIRQKEYGITNPDRYLDKIYSPGINDVQKSFESNFIASIYINPFQFHSKSRYYGISVGMSLLDVSTGDNKIFETASSNNDIIYPLDEIYRLLQIYQPIEVLVYLPSNIYSTDTKYVNDNILLNADTPLTQDILIKMLELNRTTYHFRPHISKYEKKVYQEEILNKIFENNTKLTIFEYLDLFYLGDGIKSYIYVLQFAYEHNQEIIKRIHKPEIIEEDEHLILSYNSLRQLDVIPNRNNYIDNYRPVYDSLFSVVNKCSTSMGKRLLKERICKPITNVNELKKRYDHIKLFMMNIADVQGQNENQNSATFRPRYKSYKTYMSNIIDLERSYRKMTIGILQLGEFLGVRTSLTNILTLIKFYESDIKQINDDQECNNKYKNLNTNFFLTRKTIISFKEFVKEYENMIDFKKLTAFYKAKVISNIFKKGVYPELDDLQIKINMSDKVFESTVKELEKYINDSKSRGNSASLIKICKTEKDGKYLELTKRRWDILNREFTRLGKPKLNIKIDGNIMLTLNTADIKTKKKTNYVKLEISALENNANSLIGYQDKMNRKCIEYFKEFSQNISIKYGETIETIVNQVASLDVTISGAEVATKYKYCSPTISVKSTDSTGELTGTTESYINVKALRHPIIERINEKTEYIPNDIKLSINDTLGILLYGCNMSGKSSTMKAVGNNIILAQAGLFVAAESFEYYPYKYIFTRISGDDNLQKGHSSFAVEMLELRNILQRCNSCSLVLGDELCRGTESVSGLAIVAAGIHELNKLNTQFIFATHLHGLDALPEIEKLERVKAMHLTVKFDKDTDVLIYDRLLKPGPGSSLYGLEVCRAMGMPNQFLKFAHKIRRREAGESETLLGNEKTSKYNAKLYIGTCKICGVNAEETHHIKYQKDADAQGFIGHTHKNKISNLVPLCKECHKKETYNKINIIGWEDTTQGRRLKVE